MEFKWPRKSNYWLKWISILGERVENALGPCPPRCLQQSSGDTIVHTDNCFTADFQVVGFDFLQGVDPDAVPANEKELLSNNGESFLSRNVDVQGEAIHAGLSRNND
jgi:hypothetical protein